MVSTIFRSMAATLVLAVLLCVVYPLAVTGAGKIFFREKANGSLITSEKGVVVGSHLIGQVFTRPEYFHGRPSNAGSGYDASNSSGSNLGPTNQKLYDNVKANVDAFLKENPSIERGQVPVDMVTSSGSGLDPHVSLEGAQAQVPRVALARRLDVEKIRTIVEEHRLGPQWGLFGETTVNVLELNLALDRLVKK